MIENIKKIAYRRYQFDWMSRHDYSIADIFEACKDIATNLSIDCELDNNVCHAADQVEEYFEQNGFDGELYNCYDMFLQCEFLNIEYMHDILECDEYSEYVRYMMLTNQGYRNYLDDIYGDVYGIE